MNKPTTNKYPIHDLLQSRWSPRAFDRRPVEPEKLQSLFEAARWSPSGANLQPWSYIVTTSDAPESFSRLLSTLTERNQRWAQSAPVLMLTLARTVNEDGRRNPWSHYDLGQSIAHLSVEATNRGLSVHQMGGFDLEKARTAFGIPEGFEPVTVVAIGYPGEPENLTDDFREKELAPRVRKEISEFVFQNEWAQPFAERELAAAGAPETERR